jgi:hypothetical protein
MAPELGAAGRIEAHDAVAGEHDHLLASLHGDEDRRGRGDGEVSAAPRDAPVVLVERHDRLPGAARRRDDQIPVGQQAATVAGLARHDAVVRRRPEPAFLTAIDAHSGEVAWRDRTFARSTLLYADGKLIILDEDGTLGLATVSRRGLRVLARAPVLSATAWTVPTLAGTKLYLRDRADIVALELGAS